MFGLCLIYMPHYHTFNYYGYILPTDWYYDTYILVVDCVCIPILLIARWMYLLLLYTTIIIRYYALPADWYYVWSITSTICTIVSVTVWLSRTVRIFTTQTTPAIKTGAVWDTAVTVTWWEQDIIMYSWHSHITFLKYQYWFTISDCEETLSSKSIKCHM